MPKDPKEIRQAKEEANNLAKLGKYDEAIKVLTKLSQWEKREVQHLIKIAELYGKLRNPAKQIEWYQNAAARYAEQGHLPKAIAMSKIILGIDPKHEQTQAMLAELYAQRIPAATMATPVAVPAAARPAPPPPRPAPPVAAPVVTAPPPAVNVAPEPDVELDIDIEPPAVLLEQLPRLPLFSELTADEFRRLIDYIEVCSYEENQHVVTEGEPGNSFYVISSGSAAVVKEDYAGLSVELATLSDGAFFGEFGYLAGIERTASVVARGPLEVLSFSREGMDKLIAEHARVRSVLQQFYRERVLSTLMSISPLFEPFEPAARREIAQRFDYREVAPDSLVIRQGDVAQGLFVIMSGEVAVEQDGVSLATLHAGEFFGEMSLLTGEPTNATVRTTKKSAVFRLAPEEFQGVAEAHPELIEIMGAFAAERRLHNEAVTQLAVQRGEAGLV